MWHAEKKKQQNFPSRVQWAENGENAEKGELLINISWLESDFGETLSTGIQETGLEIQPLKGK